MGRDLTVGQEMPVTAYQVEAAPMKVFSLIMRDPNPLHFDAVHVAALGGGDRTVNQGTINAAYPINALLTWRGGSDAVARVRRFTCRFSTTIRAGDHLTAHGLVSGIDADGTAEIELWLETSDGLRAVTGSALVAAPARAA